MSLVLAVLAVAIVYLLLDIRSTVRHEAPSKGGSSVVMDTSALVDGRVVDIIESGFLNGAVIVPKVVLNELQLLADGKDVHKRTRARVGLEAAERLRSYASVQVIVDEDCAEGDVPTDDAVLKIAAARHARLCTTDYNLQKVAAAEGVATCNVNELSYMLRPSVLPGEHISVDVIKKGDTRTQGVAYLDDGTMVIVENGHKSVGGNVSVRIDKILQTKSGKMIFATLKK